MRVPNDVLLVDVDTLQRQESQTSHGGVFTCLKGPIRLVTVAIAHEMPKTYIAQSVDEAGGDLDLFKFQLDGFRSGAVEAELDDRFIAERQVTVD